MVRNWLANARTDHPGSTQPEKAYRLLRTILNVAVDDEKIRVNPCRIRGAGKEKADERPIVGPEEVLRIADAIEPQYRALVILGAWCSLRVGELAGLRRGRFDELHRKLYVVEQAVELANGRVVFKEPKWDSKREVDLDPDDVELLKRTPSPVRGRFRRRTPVTSPGGLPLRRTKFRVRWAQACAKAGINGLHFHDLRGSGATWRSQEGATLKEVMQALGHRTPTAALRYQHATSERQQEIAKRLGQLRRAAAAAAESAPKMRDIAH
jgi:integrase